jgi:hypothetical protein
MDARGMIGGMTTATMSGVTLVDTSKVTGRRPLRFNTIEESLTEANRLVEADRGGRLAQLGNWTLGQSLNHLGAWAEYAYVGYPMRPPLWVKLMIRPMKNRYLHKGFPAGVRFSGVAGGTYAMERVPLEQALPRFRAAYERLKKEPPTIRNPVFGDLTHDQWVQFNLRHAELHLSFLRLQ